MRILLGVLLLGSLLVASACNKKTEEAKGGGRSYQAVGKDGAGESNGDAAKDDGTSAAIPIKDGKALLSAENSKIAFVGSKTGGQHTGGFSKFTGSVEVTPDGKSLKSVTVDIDTDSIFTDTGKLTAHLKTADFFEVQKYPKATFESTKIEPADGKDATHNITGKLTLHGETKELTFPATVKIENNTLAADSSFIFKRVEHGIKFNPGMVNDEVKITLKVGVSPK